MTHPDNKIHTFLLTFTEQVWSEEEIVHQQFMLAP